MNNKSKNISRLTKQFFLIAAILIAHVKLSANNIEEVDVCIYGANSAGIIAAYTAKKSGKSVLLIEPGNHIGGASSGGLGFTDIGNKYVVQGLSKDFYRKLGRHYGKLEQWIFEPSVAKKVFEDYLNKADIKVRQGKRLLSVSKKENQITSIVVEDSYNPKLETQQTIKAKVFIDCSYEGDLMAKTGVSYTVGREANATYGETYNGVQLMKGHQFPDGVDPYIVKGKPESGLLWGVSPKPLSANGTGDKKVQAYNFRVCLTDSAENRVEITKPDNYDPSRYELLLRMKEILPWTSCKEVLIWKNMPNRKTDINNRGGFSTDMIGMNWDYPEASYERRAEIIKAHEDYTKGLFYFIGNDQRIPANIRAEMKEWGYPKDEYVDNKHWSPQLYVRESRRMIGELVMNQHHCEGREIVRDAIAWAAYAMDSHNCDRHVVDGMVKNEGNVEIRGFSPYPISYRAITPLKEEASNLLVPVCLSASHIAYGSIRMEPVFMVLAQSAAVAACLAIDNNKNEVQNVDVELIHKELSANPFADNRIPDVIVDNMDKNTQVKGEWSLVTKEGYGPDFLCDMKYSEKEKSVKYMPEIKTSGEYNVYFYLPKVKNSTSKINVSIFDGAKLTERIVSTTDIKVEGQTSGMWVSLGKYNLDKTKNSFVEISNKGADGNVAADAVLFVYANNESI